MLNGQPLGPILLKMNLFWCLHFDTNSDRSFSNLSLSSNSHIINFSVVQRPQVFDMLLYPGALFMMDHFTPYS